MSANQQISHQVETTSGTQVSLQPQAVNLSCAEREQNFHLDFFRIDGVNRRFALEERKLPNLLDMTENDLYKHLRPLDNSDNGTVTPTRESTSSTLRYTFMKLRKPHEPFCRVTADEMRLLNGRINDIWKDMNTSVTLVEFATELQSRLKYLKSFFEEEARKFVDCCDGNGQDNEAVAKELLNPDTMAVVAGDVDIPVIMSFGKEQFYSSRFRTLMSSNLARVAQNTQNMPLLLITVKWDIINDNSIHENEKRNMQRLALNPIDEPEEEPNYHLRFFDIVDVDTYRFVADGPEDESLPDLLGMTDDELTEMFGARVHDDNYPVTSPEEASSEHRVKHTKMEVRKAGERRLTVTIDERRLFRERINHIWASIGSSMDMVSFVIELKSRLKYLKKFFEEEARDFANKYDSDNEDDEDIVLDILDPDSMEVAGSVVLNMVMFVNKEDFYSLRFRKLMSRFLDQNLSQLRDDKNTPDILVLVTVVNWLRIRKELSSTLPLEQVLSCVVYKLRDGAPENERDICPICCEEFDDEEAATKLSECRCLYHLKCAHQMFDKSTKCCLCLHEYATDYMKRMANLTVPYFD